MPDLSQSLRGSDLGFMRMIANAWGIDLDAPDAYTALPSLIKSLTDKSLLEEIVTALPAEALQALQDLVDHDGHIAWTHFSRQHGEIRQMGAAMRDRERPDLSPISPAEILYYRALIGKDFLNLPPEPQEFAYIPDDLLGIMPLSPTQEEKPLGRPATPKEIKFQIQANDYILDDACTLLANYRTGSSDLDPGFILSGIPLTLLDILLKESGLLDIDGVPIPENIRLFLESNRSKALHLLVQAWMRSTAFNELRSIQDFIFEGNWKNDPLRSRQAILELLSTLPENNWWNIASFIKSVKEKKPDFQRTAGEYQSWSIRLREGEPDSAGKDRYLKGFSSWDEVEGRLTNFMISGPLHWLGLFHLASTEPGSPPKAFHPTPQARSLWQDSAPDNSSKEEDKIRVKLDGVLHVPRLVPRPVRYQVARFCEWESVRSTPKHGHEFIYRISPKSLKNAAENGLRVKHLLHLLQQHNASPLPPTLIKALEGWEANGAQVSATKVILLKVSSPEILQALRSTKSSRYLLEILSPVAAVLQPGSSETVRKQLVELGYLGDFSLDE